MILMMYTINIICYKIKNTHSKHIEYELMLKMWELALSK